MIEELSDLQADINIAKKKFERKYARPPRMIIFQSDRFLIPPTSLDLYPMAVHFSPAIHSKFEVF